MFFGGKIYSFQWYYSRGVIKFVSPQWNVSNKKNCILLRINKVKKYWFFIFLENNCFSNFFLFLDILNGIGWFVIVFYCRYDHDATRLISRPSTIVSFSRLWQSSVSGASVVLLPGFLTSEVVRRVLCPKQIHHCLVLTKFQLSPILSFFNSLFPIFFHFVPYSISRRLRKR